MASWIKCPGGDWRNLRYFEHAYIASADDHTQPLAVVKEGNEKYYIVARTTDGAPYTIKAGLRSHAEAQEVLDTIMNYLNKD